MLFKRRKQTPESTPKFPGTDAFLNGYQALVYAESLASDALCVLSAPGQSTFADARAALRRQDLLPAASRDDLLCMMSESHSLMGVAVGHSLTGLRSAVFADGEALLGATESLATAVGKRLSMVFNVASRPSIRHATARHGAHDDLNGLGESGAVVMMASRAQELADFALIAHRVAELSLTPVVVGRDGETGLTWEPIALPEAALIAQFLGRSDDLIDVPGRAQKELFGERRRRVPAFFDLDRPLGIGGSQDSDSFFRAVAASRPYFVELLSALLDQAFAEFAGLTGRQYQRVIPYRCEDAEVVVVARGAIIPSLHAVVDHLRDVQRIKAGVINVAVSRPFPGAELSHLLAGRRAVCVLERCDFPLSEDAPLTRELRSALDKALENGFDGDTEAFPGYASIRRLKDRPRVSCGAYGIGSGLPGVGDLLAVFEQLQRPEGRPRQFYLGVQPSTSHRNFPTLETVERSLRQAEFTLEAHLLSANGTPHAALAAHRGYQLHTPAGLGGDVVGELLARALADALGWVVKGVPDREVAVGNRASVYTVISADDRSGLRSDPAENDVLVVSGLDFYRSPERLKGLKRGGVLVVQCEWSADALWGRLARRVREWIQRNELVLFRINALEIARAHTSDPYYVDQVALFALAGAFLRVCPQISASECASAVSALQRLVGEQFGADQVLTKQIGATIDAAMSQLESIDPATLTVPTQPPSAEPKAPWSVREVTQFDRSLYDLGRFWDSVGYFFETGQASETLADPFVATGMIPARSAVFRDQSIQRSRLPRLIPELCTGCGVCWTVCPDTALPPSLHRVEELIETAVARCADQGHAMTQIKRVADALGKLAYRTAQKDDLSQYRSLDSLLRAAFDVLSEKLDLTDEKRQTLADEFALLEQAVGTFPLIRTARFFVAPHQAQKGSGRLLSIAVNPSTCKSCLLCVQECPEGALESATQTAERVEENRANIEFYERLPDRAIGDLLQTCVDEEQPESLMQLMLNRETYHTLVGGDGAFAGHGPKIATHLVTAMAEALARPRVSQRLAALDTLLTRLAAQMQGELHKRVEINDFDAFARRLKGLGTGNPTLADLVSSNGDRQDAEEGRALVRQGELLSELKVLRQLIASGPTGNGRARMALTLNLGHSQMWSGSYPYNPHTAPWVGSLPDDAPSVAEGLRDGLIQQLVAECRTVRRAELECDGSRETERHLATIDALSWGSLSADEQALLPPLLVFDDGGAASVQNVLRLLSGPVPIKIIIIDPLGAELTSQGGFAVTTQLEPALLALGAGDAFVLQSTIGHPEHLLAGLREGLRQNRPALFQIYAPDPQLCGVGPRQVAELARLAVASRVVTLFRHDPEAGLTLGERLDLTGNPLAERDWMAVSQRVGQRAVETTKTPADWAFAQARFHDHFEPLPKGRWSEQMRSLSDYLAADAAERAELTPVLDLTHQDRVVRLGLSASIASLAENRLKRWRLLRRMTVAPAAPVQTVVAAAPSTPATFAAAVASGGDAVETLTRNLLRLCAAGPSGDLLAQTLRGFVATPEDGEAH